MACLASSRPSRSRSGTPQRNSHRVICPDRSAAGPVLDVLPARCRSCGRDHRRGVSKGPPVTGGPFRCDGGDARIRTGDEGFAGPCLATWPRRRVWRHRAPYQERPASVGHFGPLGPTFVVTMERTKGFEPSTPTLARWCSTTELRPRARGSLPCPQRGCKKLFGPRRSVGPGRGFGPAETGGWRNPARLVQYRSLLIEAAHNGRLAQGESTSLTRKGSEVQIL